MKKIILIASAVLLIAGFGLLWLLNNGIPFGVDDPPLLEKTGIMVEDLVYDSRFISDYGPILPFGGKLYDPDGGFKLSPTYEYYLRAGARISSPLDGVVDQIEYQPQDGDYYIWIKPSPRSAWIVEIDHLKDPAVQSGDKVKAGDYLGTAGNWYPNSGVGRTELMLVKRGAIQHYYCPYLYMSEALQRDFRRQAAKVYDEWRQQHGGTANSTALSGLESQRYGR